MKFNKQALFIIAFITGSASAMYKEVSDSLIQECRNYLGKHAAQDQNVLRMFDTTIAAWKNYFDHNKNFDLPLLLKGIKFAAEKHAGQTRDGIISTPYIIHPIGVAKLIWDGKIRDERTLVSALLHDTLEDTATTQEELKQHFGNKICSIVVELTDDPALSSEEQKIKQIEHALYYSTDARLIKLADRLYNMKDVRNLPIKDRKKWLKYADFGTQLLQALNGTNDFLETELEKEILATQIHFLFAEAEASD